jgi:hypothetical protein
MPPLREIVFLRNAIILWIIANCFGCILGPEQPKQAGDDRVTVHAATLVAYAAAADPEYVDRFEPEPTPPPAPAPKVRAIDPPAIQPQSKPLPPRRRVQAIVFVGPSCAPCERLKQFINTRMVPRGWSVGPQGMIDFADVTHDALAFTYGVQSSHVPQVVVLRDGKVIGRRVGYTGDDFGAWLNSVHPHWQER